MNLSRIILVTIAIVALTGPVSGRRRHRAQNSVADCDNVSNFDSLRKKIQSYRDDINKIIHLVEEGEEKNKTWEELALFCDTFGPRLSGSKSLESAIGYMEGKMRNDSGLNVTAEPVMIPKWEVHDQWAEITAPRRHKMSILALGSSVSTNGPIEKQVVLVRDFQELDKVGAINGLKDKIVVYNYKFEGYPKSVIYRTQGASRAAKYEAAAALVRSVTPFSIYSPHTGMGSRSIPTAAITLEDADLIERLIKRGKTVTMRLNIETEHFDDVQSYNLVGDITGSTRPQEVVLVSGHIDSWYNTDGAMDDGGGMMISYKALDVLRKLNLQGERTIRAVLWTSEEFGLVGAQQYFKNHEHELENFKAVIESDEGTFRPLGLSFKNMGTIGQCAIWEILKLTAKIGTRELTSRFEGSDIEVFTDNGVPGLSLLNENSQYFYFHHTSGDSMTVEDPESLNRATILFASTAYVLSQLDVELNN